MLSLAVFMPEGLRRRVWQLRGDIDTPKPSLVERADALRLSLAEPLKKARGGVKKPLRSIADHMSSAKDSVQQGLKSASQKAGQLKNSLKERKPRLRMGWPWSLNTRPKNSSEPTETAAVVEASTVEESTA